MIRGSSLAALLVSGLALSASVNALDMDGFKAKFNSLIK
jgi:hypothetical protein